MAAPAEPRTPNVHRAKQIAPRECGWKHGDSGHSAGEKTCLIKTDKNQLDSDWPSHGRRLHSERYINVSGRPARSQCSHRRLPKVSTERSNRAVRRLNPRTEPVLWSLSSEQG